MNQLVNLTLDSSVTAASANGLNRLRSPLPVSLLQLVMENDLHLDWLTGWHSLTHLGLMSCHIVSGLEPLAELPKLRTLRLHDCTHAAEAIDLSPLAALHELTIRLYGDTSVQGEDAFPPGRIIYLG
ncbi:hypothetical protein [Streptomyces sp. JV176]|uniref:hypothetical protein n=1 Tax=Streptomyces sp. JV176 TaxID=858630 RepID=UPI002E7A4049|nr:hypothetical protein [Streptomyces sp. JV176]